VYNDSADISKETQAYLASRPNRFQYVLTPKIGSGAQYRGYRGNPLRQDGPARSFDISEVQSWEELRDRILLAIAEINAALVLHRGKKFNALTPASQDTI